VFFGVLAVGGAAAPAGKDPSIALVRRPISNFGHVYAGWNVWFSSDGQGESDPALPYPPTETCGTARRGERLVFLTIPPGPDPALGRAGTGPRSAAALIAEDGEIGSAVAPRLPRAVFRTRNLDRSADEKPLFSRAKV